MFIMRNIQDMNKLCGRNEKLRNVRACGMDVEQWG
jgi:hypothetical protein